MALTYKEAQLVKATIPFLREHGETVSDIVYTTLIKRHPQLNNTLNLIHLKDGRLARALTVVILRFASNINNVYELIPKLGRQASQHSPFLIRCPSPPSCLLRSCERERVCVKETLEGRRREEAHII